MSLFQHCPELVVLAGGVGELLVLATQPGSSRLLQPGQLVWAAATPCRWIALHEGSWLLLCRATRTHPPTPC